MAGMEGWAFFFFFWGANNFYFFYKHTKESCNAASIGCNPGPQVCTFLCDWSCDGRTFHLAFIVYYDPCIIFKVKKHTIFSLV